MSISWLAIIVVVVVGLLVLKFLVKPLFKIVLLAAVALAVYFLFLH